MTAVDLAHELAFRLIAVLRSRPAERLLSSEGGSAYEAAGWQRGGSVDWPGGSAV